MSEKCVCDTAFNRQELQEHKKPFWEAFDKLCGETPNEDSTCRRIRKNQELYLEYQQKCLNQYDPTLQQAIENAGDIIRELSKCGYEPPTCHLPYVEEKIRFLIRNVDEIATRKE